MKYLKRSFIQSVKGKIIVAFIIASCALLLAWSISSVAFKEMLGTVKTISSPNEKLSLVNNIYRGITHLDQIHREMVSKKKDKYQDTLLLRLKYLRHNIDTLSNLYKDSPIQVSRIMSIRKLLQEREQLFLDYLRFREGIISNKAFSARLSSINGLIVNSSKKPDTTTLKLVEKKTYTTVYPSEETTPPKSLLGRIFNWKKKPARNTDPGKIINEELNIKIDTIAFAKEDSIISKVEKAVLDIEKEHRMQSAEFVNNQTELANAGNILTTQMLSILEQIDQEVVKQAVLNNNQAEKVVSTSVRHINIIIITFFLITVILLGLILSDITKSNQYRAALEIAKNEAEYHSAAKQRFLSNMSHEIRTPLQAIIGYAELIQKQEKPKRQDVEAIYSSSEYLLQIVNEVLDYSRIISGKFFFASSTFDLRELLDEVVSVMKIHADKKSLALVSNYATVTSEFIEGDPFRLKQILYNLLSNAIKFTDSGKITLSVTCKHQQENSHITFRIDDTGCGILDENIKHIFDEFEQGRLSENDRNSGTGLGLSIVKSLTENQGGRIYVESIAGKGSSFIVYLKFARAKEAIAAKQEYQRERTAYSGKVWIVDDDSFILQICSSILANNKIEHVCFNSSADILAASWDSAVTHILIDMRMPGINGTELYGLLKKRIPSKVKIVALTAQALPQERQGILKLGFDGVLMKPFRESEMIGLFYDNIIPNKIEDQERSGLPNFEALQKMTLGDESLMRKILKRFTEDSANDITELQIAMERSDTEQVILLLHRIAGRTAQIGSTTLAADFRKIEIDIQPCMPDDKWKKEIDKHVLNLDALNQVIENYILDVSVT